MYDYKILTSDPESPSQIDPTPQCSGRLKGRVNRSGPGKNFETRGQTIKIDSEL